MGVIGGLLFSGVREPQRPALSDLLSHYQEQKAQDLTRGLSHSKFAEMTEDEIVAELAGWLVFDPLCIDRNAATSHVTQMLVEADSVAGLSIKVEGFKITKTFPFSGNPQLFDLKARIFGYNCPYGKVDGQKLTIGMEVREDQTYAAVNHIKSTIELVERCIASQLPELDEHRAKLPQLLLPLVQKRRKLCSAEFYLKNQLDAI